MSIRKYAGLGFGIVLSLILGASVLASQIGPNYISNKAPGWNSPIYNASSTTFSIQYCVSNGSYGLYDWMHHWPFFPSTGTQLKAITCAYNSTWRSASWSASGTADYSVEYTVDNIVYIQHEYYKIVYQP